MTAGYKDPRNKSKAVLHAAMRGGKAVAVKDYSGRSLPARLYGRFTLTNEERAYARLAGVRGIPACYGRPVRDVLELEHIPSRPLSAFKAGAVSPAVFEKLERIVAAMHARGVANGDVHRSNVLMGDDGEVYLIDFAHSLAARDPRQPGLAVRLLMQLDLYALARMKARYLKLEKPVPGGLFGALYGAGTALKKGIRRIKKLFAG